MCRLTPLYPPLQLKLRSQIALEQERLLTESAEQRQQLERQLKEVTERQTAAAADSDRLQAEIAELQAKLDTAQKLAKTNENGEPPPPDSGTGTRGGRRGPPLGDRCVVVRGDGTASGSV